MLNMRCSWIDVETCSNPLQNSHIWCCALSSQIPKLLNFYLVACNYIQLQFIKLIDESRLNNVFRHPIIQATRVHLATVSLRHSLNKQVSEQKGCGHVIQVRARARERTGKKFLLPFSSPIAPSLPALTCEAAINACVFPRISYAHMQNV